MTPLQWVLAAVGGISLIAGVSGLLWALGVFAAPPIVTYVNERLGRRMDRGIEADIVLVQLKRIPSSEDYTLGVRYGTGSPKPYRVKVSDDGMMLIRAIAGGFEEEVGDIIMTVDDNGDGFYQGDAIVESSTVD